MRIIIKELVCLVLVLCIKLNKLIQSGLSQEVTAIQTYFDLSLNLVFLIHLVQ